MPDVREFTDGSARRLHGGALAGVPGTGLTRSELMTAREVAALLEVPVSTVHEWGRNGTLPRVKLGRHVRFIRSRVEAAILGAASDGR